MGIARPRRIASLIVLAFVITAFAVMGAGGSTKKNPVPAQTTTPVLASGVAPVKGGTVTVTATPDLADVGDSAAPIQVATAPIDRSGNFVLQPTTTAGAMASVIASALAQNNGWVNLDLIETGADGATTIQSIARQFVDASGQPVSPSAFQAAEAVAGQPASAATASASGIGHWIGAEGDSTTVDPTTYAAIGRASSAALEGSSGAASPEAAAAVPPPCTQTVTVVGQTNQDSVIGEFHTPRDMVAADTGFVYGKTADTTSDVGVSAGGANWSISGSVHIGNAGGGYGGYYPGSDTGNKVVSGFFYKDLHYTYPNYSYCPSNYYETKQWSWSATPHPAWPGENVHNLDGFCTTRPIGQVADLGKGGVFDRSRNSFIRFGGAFNVFGFSGGTQSGASSFVQVHYKAGQNNTNHYICGNGNSPLYSTRIFAEG